MGYDKPNWTQTPNELLDDHMADMGEAELKVVLAVIRATFGWQKDSDCLSISQLEEMTGLSNRGVIDGTRAAMERGVIDRAKDGQTHRYWIVFNDEEPTPDELGDDPEGGENPSQKGVNISHAGGENPSQKRVNDSHTQKKGDKENKEKESKENGSGGTGQALDDQPEDESLPDDDTKHPAIQVYRKYAQRYPNHMARRRIIDAVGEKGSSQFDERMSPWRETCKDWHENSWSFSNIDGMIDRMLRYLGGDVGKPTSLKEDALDGQFLSRAQMDVVTRKTDIQRDDFGKGEKGFRMYSHAIEKHKE